MPRHIEKHVPASGKYRNDGYLLRSLDGGLTWQKREETVVWIEGMTFSQIQRELNKAFKNKEEARFQTRNAYYGDADFGNGPEEPHIENVVIGWVPATDDEIARMKNV